MSKIFYKAMIEDIQNEKCTDAELEALLDAFAYTVKKRQQRWQEKHGLNSPIMPPPNNTASTASP